MSRRIPFETRRLLHSVTEKHSHYLRIFSFGYLQPRPPWKKPPAIGHLGTSTYGDLHPLPLSLYSILYHVTEYRIDNRNEIAFYFYDLKFGFWKIERDFHKVKRLYFLFYTILSRVWRSILRIANVWRDYPPRLYFYFLCKYLYL